MAQNDSILISRILYNMREGYYNNALKLIKNGLEIYKDDCILKFYLSINLLIQGRLLEAIKELEAIREDIKVGFGACHALVYAYNKFMTIGLEAVCETQKKIEAYSLKLDEKDYYAGNYYAGYFWYSINFLDKAKEFVDKSLSLNNEFYENICLKGWLENNLDEAFKYFEQASSHDSKFFDAQLGMAKCKELNNTFSLALEIINGISIENPNTIEIVLEKMRLQLIYQDWNQLNIVATHALTLDNECLEALRYRVLKLLCKDGQYEEAAVAIKNLFNILEIKEPNSHVLFYKYARVFARVCSKNLAVLKETEKYIEKSVLLDPNNIDYLNELGSQKLKLSNTKGALEIFSNVLTKDSNNIIALLGKLGCHIFDDRLDDIEEQFNFLEKKEMHDNAEYAFLKYIYSKKVNPSTNDINYIDVAIISHFKTLKKLPLGNEYFYNLQPDFVLDFVKEYMKHAPSDPIQERHEMHPILKKCDAILEPLTKAIPGLIQGLYFLAKIKFVCGKTDQAKIILERVLEKNPSHFEANLLLPQICLKVNDLEEANKFLVYGMNSKRAKKEVESCSIEIFEDDKIMECPVCIEIFNSNDKVPRQLNCQHNICNQCLQKLKMNNSKTSLDCPQCRQKTDFGSHEIKKSLVIMALIERFKKKKAE